MGCFTISERDNTEVSLKSLRAMLETKQAPLPSPCSIVIKKIVERKLCFLNRKTLRARTKLLDTASLSLAKAKAQRALLSLNPSSNNTPLTLISLNPSSNNTPLTLISLNRSSINTPLTLISLPSSNNTTLFPLPLPPGHYINTNSSSNPSISPNLSLNSHSITSEALTPLSSTSNPSISPNFSLNSHSSEVSSTSNPSISPNFSLNSHSITSEALTPLSSTSSSIFSATPSSSSSSTCSDLRCNSLSHIVDDHSHSFGIPLPLPSPNMVYVASLLREFSPHELARACENFNESHKLRDGAIGPVYRAILETSTLEVARVTTNIGRKKWKAQVQFLARLAHPNLCNVMGFSYQKANYGEACNRTNGDNIGFIVYENSENGSLDEFLQNGEKDHCHIDWPTRLKIATGAAEGLAFLLERMPKQILNGPFKMNNIQVDSLVNAKLSDFVFSDQQNGNEGIAFDVRGFAIVLLQLFNFSSHPQDGKPLDLEVNPQIWGSYPPKDAKLVIELAATCLLPEASLRPSMRHVARALRSIEPVPTFAPKNKKRRTFTFG